MEGLRQFCSRRFNCFKDPGYQVEAVVVADPKAFTEVFLGQRSLKSATRGGDIIVKPH